MKKFFFLAPLFLVLFLVSFSQQVFALDERCADKSTDPWTIKEGETIKLGEENALYCTSNGILASYTTPQILWGPTQCGFDFLGCCPTSSWGCWQEGTYYIRDMYCTCNAEGDFTNPDGTLNCYYGGCEQRTTNKCVGCDDINRGCYNTETQSGDDSLCPSDTRCEDYYCSVTDYGIIEEGTPYERYVGPIGFCNWNDLCASEPPPVTEADFSIDVSPSFWIDTKGDSVTYKSYTVTLTALNDFSDSVSLSTIGCPSGANCSFDGGNSVFVSGTADTKIFRVSNLDSVNPNTYSISVLGQGGGKEHQDSTSLQVNDGSVPPPDPDPEDSVIPPYNLTGHCPSPYTTAYVDWIASGYDRYYVRMNPGANKYCWPLDSCSTGGIATDVTATEWSFPTSPDQHYTWWITVRNPDTGAWNDYVGSYDLSCQVPTPATANISANPTTIPYNTSTTLNWSYSNATSCTITPPATIGGYPSGNGSVDTSHLLVSRTYTIACDPIGPNSFKSVTVTVTPSLEDQSLTIICSGQGTVTSDPAGAACNTSVDFEEGTEVTLTATPIGSRIFTGWSGDCSGRGECTLILSSPKTVYANFIVDPKYREF